MIGGIIKKLFLCSLLVFMALCLFLPYEVQALSPGQEAPPFTLQLFEGGNLNLTELRGKPVVLNFWASW